MKNLINWSNADRRERAVFVIAIAVTLSAIGLMATLAWLHGGLLEPKGSWLSFLPWVVLSFSLATLLAIVGEMRRLPRANWISDKCHACNFPFAVGDLVVERRWWVLRHGGGDSRRRILLCDSCNWLPGTSRTASN